MQVTDGIAARRALLRPFILSFFMLLSWFVVPHAHAECFDDYVSNGAYPTDPNCGFLAASANFKSGFACGEPFTIASYCGGASGGTTVEPISPDDTVTLDGDGTGGQPGGSDGSGGCSGGDATAGCGSSTSGGDPVRLYTGQFHLVAHDLHVADTIALDLARVYRSSAYDTSGRPMAGAFGIGATFNYDSYLTVSAADSNNLRQLIQLYLPSGIHVPFTLRAGTSATWDDLTSAGEFYRGSITGNGTTKLLTLRDGHTMQFTMFAGLYRLTRVQDRNGNTVAINRNSSTGAITGINCPNGRALTFASIVGARGTPLVSRISDPLNRQVNYQYDGQDRLTQVTDAGGGVWKYGWDTKSRLVSVTDPEGNQQVVNTYDDSDRVTAQKLADGSTFGFAYTVTGSKITQTDVTDRRGSIRRVVFDANGRVVSNTYPAGQSIAQVQTFTRDPTGRVTNLTAADRRYTYTYDANGNRISEADQYGVLATRTFDSYSQVLTEAQAGDPQRGVSTVYTYDAKGNRLTLTDRLGNRTTQTNDSQGRPLTVTDALKGVTKYTWSGADLTAITDALSRTTQFTADAAGRVTAVQDPLGNKTTRTLDALDRTTTVIDALGGVTRFTWDHNGHLLGQADPKGVTTAYTYNAIGRAVSKSDPLGHAETYTWNNAGQLASVTDRKGQLTTYWYDVAGELQSVYFNPDGNPLGAPVRSLGYGWDEYGRLQGTSDGGVGRTPVGSRYYFDSVTGKVSQWVETPGTQQGFITYGYDPDSRDLSFIGAKDGTISYSHDAEHRVTQVQYAVDGEPLRVFGYKYDALGRGSQATLANGITATYTWDAASQLTGITYKRADGSVLGDLTYGYDLAGRRTSAGGSFAKADLPAAVSDAQYNAANQLTHWSGNTLAYDLNGNLASDGSNRYMWNEQNLLGQISGSVSASFSYDIWGRRRDQTVNGHSQQSFWNGDELRFTIVDGDYAHRNRMFSAYPESRLDELTYRRIGDDAGQDSYILRDANNNVIALTDANQQSQTQYTYQPYGTTTQTGAVDPNLQQYTGRENDGTGLYYYRSRYYSPAIGRFISEDPIGYASGQTNGYAYVGGNPVQFTDPAGEVGLPMNGPANTWVLNPSGSGQTRLYDPNGRPAVDLDFDHSHGGMRPHAHNWDGNNRDWAVAPFCPL
ncbi:RHS repeat-associated core domain-containing protein [Paraburkholderia phytofirmans]|uniref:YD repeat protein n=2 Tax=Paraburkholderia phytofirmans TaxID=261302 RepID=B2TA57_PARPJ|nr:RHS repeat-associated core domain-containing protein [Paraburkholderia phytofirmans]ACD21359.1 YD repeat protein [Paraburkholderia phytofirmans PsJN]